MAGTQDQGRVVLLPYSNLVAVNITRRLTEPEIEALFGQNGQAFAQNVPLTGQSAEPAAAERAADAEDGNPPPHRPAMPSKTELLAKLRARLSEANKAGG